MREKAIERKLVMAVKAAGGIAVIAHPGLIKNQSLINEVIAAGIQGIEVYYPDHTPEQIEKYEKLAVKHGLLMTGGSDYHGLSGDPNDPRLGCCGISTEQIEKIKKYQRNMRKK